MPELPEIETIKRALSACMPGVSGVKMEIFTPKMRTPLAPLLDPGLLHTPVVDVRRRARYLIMEFANRRALLMHLGMSGVIRVEAPRERRKHEHVIMTLSNGMTFRFECTRRFSILIPVTLPAPGAEPLELAGLGVEPLSDAFTPEYVYRALRERKNPLKVAVMDNAIVVGVGNIYATEALFQAGLHPARLAGSLTRKEASRLVPAIREVLNRAIEAGGTTFHDYRQIDGTEGMFEQELLAYGRAGQPCRHCGSIMVSVKLGGRTSVYCPKCQPLR